MKNINEILNLKNINVLNFKYFNDKIEIDIELEKKIQVCPRCNRETDWIQSSRIQKIRDVNFGDRKSYLNLHKKRYKCKFCSKTFLEDNNFLNVYQRMTTRLVNEILLKLESERSFTSIARDYDISVNTIIRLFDKIQYPSANLENVEVLSIDEFKGNTGGEKYNCIIADPKRKIILDILPKRYKTDLQIYFYKIDKKTRDSIKIFISDMWQTYFDIAKDKFKKSKFVVDKYHWIRQVIWAFENVRKEEQKKFSREYRKYFKRSKSLLTKKFKFLSDEKKQEVNIMLYYSEKLRIAHDLKEEFFEILKCKDRVEAKKKLTEWIIYAQSSRLIAFEKCAETFVNWSTGILNSFNTKYTNGFIEGCNNKIKVLKRNAYGYRNFKRFRNRILHMFECKKRCLNIT
nr:ISL3 family transposase [uncultured Tyzzerella sp.]